jgi:RHS repeat-associated protein
VVDASTGAVVAEYAYDPYGVPLEIGGAAAGVCPFRFQTKYFDAETGLYYFGYRYYDPLSCKWLCRDPLQENGGVNLTAYCDNDPVNKYDALGLEAYIVYRNFADSPPGGKLKSRGHFFLAFDDKNLEDVEAWQALVRGLGKYTPAGDRSAVYNPPGTPMNRIKKEDLPDPQAETFSFHPWSVYDESEGAAYSLFGSTRTSLDVTLTCGSYIGYGDDVDRRAFRNARDGGGDTHARTAIVFPLKLTDQQQANLYRAAIQSRNINNRSPESRDTSAYILGVFNCGSWTYKMLAEKGIPYPAAAQRLNRIPGLEHIPVAGMLSGGVGVRGMADYTGIPQASTVLIGTVGVVYQAGGLAVGVTTHSAQRVTTMGSWLIQNAEVLPNSADVGSTSTLGGLARWRFY